MEENVQQASRYEWRLRDKQSPVDKVPASRNVDRTEKDVLSSLAQKEPVYSGSLGLESQLAKFRSACQDFIFLDFAAAADQRTETRLWDAHSKVNKKFRPFLAQFREGDGRKKHVERRKAEKLYLSFIKSSMHFYRGYIQRLASHFSDVPQILEVAQKFNLDTFSADASEHVDDAFKKRIIRSCYSTLVQLGDLSRYRETELKTIKERNWGPAKGYYDLATALDPTSGMSYNQLAVIALTDQDHLRAVYYLYRAVSVENPAPQAQGNLELEFKKLRTRSTQGKLLAADEAEGNHHLQRRFILFHARCVEPTFAGYEDEQTKILALLADELREKPFDTVIRKFCLINIAAESTAARKVRDDVSALRSFEMLQHLNISTFIMLLNLLLEELGRLTSDSNGALDGPRANPSQITPVTRRILPHLRLYSGWLLSTVQLLLSNQSVQVPLEKLWQVYAEALSLLTNAFSILDLPEISYLLDEDQDTVAFTPFNNFVKEKRFCDGTGQIKPAHTDAAFGPRSPDNDMLYRIKCLIKEGVYLCRQQSNFGSLSIPLTFASNRFVFCGETTDDAETRLSARINRDGIDHTRGQQLDGHALNYQEAMSDAGTSESMTSTMENMVNDLTQPDAHPATTSASNVLRGSASPTSHTPVARSFAERSSISHSRPPSITARDLVQQMRPPSGSLYGDPVVSRPAGLPGIWNSPFTPRPGETPEPSPRPSTAHRSRDLAAGSPSLNSSAQFQADILHMQHQIQMRSSPPESLQPTMSSNFETPAHLKSWGRRPDGRPRSGGESPWSHSPMVAGASSIPLQQERLISTRRSPDLSSPYGAIGEPRPKSSRATAGGRPG